MADRPLDSLGTLQRAVLEMIWDLGEATVHDVRDRVTREKPLAYTTILSTIQKLEKGGWLTHRSQGRTHVYRATDTREAAEKSTLKRITKRMFKGDPFLLFQHLIQDAELTDEELNRLQRMIKDHRKGISNA